MRTRRVGAVDDPEVLRPWAELWESPGFQEWAAGVNEELEALKAVPWSLGGKALDKHAVVLQSCGMDMPTTREGMLETFMCAKAVVHYVERKLRLIESQSQAFHKLLKKVQEREGIDNGR